MRFEKHFLEYENGKPQSVWAAIIKSGINWVA